MQAPLFVRPPTDAERQALAAGLRSADAFTLRRCQVVPAGARGERVPQIARALGCSEQAVRNAIHAFGRDGSVALAKGSSRPRATRAAFDARARSGCATCCTGRRATSAGRPACGRWSWRPRPRSSRG